MRVVLYTNDMEPITTIELNSFLEKHLKAYGMCRIAVIEPPPTVAPVTAPSSAEFKIVTLHAEVFRRHGKEYMLLITHDEESAMLLKCAFLPGQQAALREIQQNAFARGFLEGLYRFGDID